jgi:16S rRNA processing protein RimM
MKNYKKENKNYLEIARLTKPQGLRGALRAQILCDSPEILRKFEGFYLGEEKSFIKVWLNEIRKGFVILTVEDIDNIVAAENLVGEILYIDREDYQLPENTWFIRDLIGLEVVDADSGEIYGKVQEILQSAPKDVYVIKSEDGRQLLFPAIPEVLINVDITSGIIKIRPLEGLFDESKDESKQECSPRRAGSARPKGGAT